MQRYEVREGDGNDGCFRRGEVEAASAFDALRKASRKKLISKPRDVRLSETWGDDQYACIVSYVAPIFGDACRWVAEARLVKVTG